MVISRDFHLETKPFDDDINAKNNTIIRKKGNKVVRSRIFGH